MVYQEEMEGLTLLAQQVLDETHISSRISSRATHITARYHALLLHLLVTSLFQTYMTIQRCAVFGYY